MYGSHFTGLGCTGTESYYTPYGSGTSMPNPDGKRYSWDGGGVAGAIAHSDWNAFISNGARFDQARYLFPLLALYGAILALAARVGGRRVGPVIGAAIVAIAIFHDVFAQLLTVSRYYA